MDLAGHSRRVWPAAVLAAQARCPTALSGAHTPAIRPPDPAGRWARAALALVANVAVRALRVSRAGSPRIRRALLPVLAGTGRWSGRRCGVGSPGRHRGRHGV